MDMGKRFIEVYTDGSCWFLKKEGGYCYIIKIGKVIRTIVSDSYKETTINRMELKAIIHALESIDVGNSIVITSDSEYCITTINKRLDYWVLNGMLAEKDNTDLWIRFLRVRDKHNKGGSNLRFNQIKGHSGNMYNDLADKGATKARLSPIKKVCSTDN